MQIDYIQFLLDFANANKDSFEPEQVTLLREAADEMLAMKEVMESMHYNMEVIFKMKEEDERTILRLESQYGVQYDRAEKLLKEQDENIKSATAVVSALAVENDNLRKERDAARRDFCNGSYDDPKLVARERGWDCFNEEDGKTSHSLS